MSKATEENKYLSEYYSVLTGATIVNCRMSEPEPGEDTDGWFESFPTFDVVLADGTKCTLEISSDPEGNGAGFIFGLPLPEEK